MQLFKDIYQATDTWPRLQAFGLVMDIRRAAMDITTNLSEGQVDPGRPEFREFVSMSQDLVTELQRLLLAAREHPNLNAASIEPLLQQTADLRQQLQGLAATLP